MKINLCYRTLVSVGMIWVVALNFYSFSWAQEQLSWNDCLKASAENHPDLISAKEEIIQSKDTKLITESVLWPQATADAGVTQSKAQASGSSAKVNTTSYNYGLSGSQLIFDSFKTLNDINAASETVKASQENFQYTSSLVRQRLRKAFVNLLKAQELIGLSEQIYDIRKQNLDLITETYNAGMEHKGAFLTAEANLAQALFEVHQAKRGLELAQRNLLKEMGEKKEKNISVQGSWDIANNYSQEPDFDTIVLDNPQLKKLIAQKNAVSFNIKSDGSSYWPSTSLVGSIGKTGEEWPPAVLDTSVGVKLSWSLLQGSRKNAQLAKDRSLLRDYVAQEQSLKDALKLSMHQSWSSLIDNIEQVQVQQKFLEALEERAKIARGQYSVGLINFDNWTIIEDNLVTTKKSHLNAQANALLSEADWIATQGRTLEYAN